MLLQIENFRCIESAEYDLASGGFFTGVNGAGKSTVLDALRLAWLGQCRGTDARGAGAKLLVGTHGSIARIELTVSDKTSITVQLNSSKSPHLTWTAKHNNKSYSNPESLLAALGVDGRPLYISVWPEKYLQELLADYLASTLDTDVPYADMKEYFNDDEIKYIKTSWDKRPGIKTVDQCRQTGDQAFALRRDLKKTVLPDQPPPAWPKSAHGDELTLVDLPRLRDLLDQLAAQRDAVLKASSTPTGDDPRVVADEVNHIQDRIKRDEKKLMDTEQEIKECEFAIDFCQDEEKSRNKNLMRATVQVESATKEVAEIAKLRDDGTCTRCGKDVTPEILDAMEKQHEAELESAKAEHAEFKAKVEEVQDKLVELRSDRKKLEHPVVIQTRIDIAQKELSKAEQRLAHAKKPMPAQDSETKLQSIEKRIAKAQQAVDVLEQIESVNAHNAAQESVRFEIEVVDKVCRAFRDGEFLNRFAKTSLDEFADQINRELESVKKQVRFQVDGKKVQMFYQNVGGPEYELALASRGEQKCLEIGVVAAFAREGVPVAVVDDLDCLDDANRRPAMQLLKGLTEATTVVLSATWTKPTTDGQGFEALSRFLRPMPLYRLG